MPIITLVPDGTSFSVPSGTSLLEALRNAGHAPEAACGGNGTCGKCRVTANGISVLACRMSVDTDLTVSLPEPSGAGTIVLEEGVSGARSADMHPLKDGPLVAIDIGTTTVVVFLLDGATGVELARDGFLNPQRPFGADVISRLQAAKNGHREELTSSIRDALDQCIRMLCRTVGISPADIGVVSLVGNPAMQQLFLGIPTDNLTAVPFAPVLTEARTVPARETLPACTNADLLVVPDIGGYIGADIVAGVLATNLDQTEHNVLLIDIGTNGEMVLSAGGRMVSCSTAAGPALEGAKIRFGMRGAPGAIDHVSVTDDGALACHVIGSGPAEGICGSGLIDAVAAALNERLINKRGRIQDPSERDGERFIPLADPVYLTQTDIREVMLAKGAIAAGVVLMTRHLGLELNDIDEVLLAGAFGSFMDPDSACRIGLIPTELQGRIRAVGNTAGAGAKQMACSEAVFRHTQDLLDRIEFLELANLPDFMSCFAKNMNFKE